MPQGLRAGPMDWREIHAAVDATGEEAIGWTLWHRLAFVDNTTVRLRYFDAVPANKTLGNMTIASQLPNRVSFACAAIRVIPMLRPNIQLVADAIGVAVGLADDVAQIFNEGVLTFTVLNKNYGEWPIYMLPPGVGVNPGGNFVSTTAAFAAANYVNMPQVGQPDPRAVYSLSKPIAIPPQTNFNATIEWPVAINTLTGNIDLVVAFDGEIIRPQQ